MVRTLRTDSANTDFQQLVTMLDADLKIRDGADHDFYQGKKTEAIRLYEKSGYARIPNYGQYENVENSICMRKDIL